MIVANVTGTEKSTILISINGVHDNSVIIQMGKTVTNDFGIGGTTFHSTLYITLNSTFRHE